MKKSIVLFMLCTVGFWSCDSSKKNEQGAAESPKENSNTPTATVANTSESQAAEKATELAKFEFEEESYDFGKIQQNDVVEHLFKFKNVGTAPLTINKIDVTCGCTTPSYSKEPIAPGEEGEILVKFNSRGKRGQQNKTITISSNVEGGTKRISIRTFVETDDTSNMMGPVKSSN